MTIHYLTKRPQTHAPDPEDTQAHRLYRLEATIDGPSVGSIQDPEFLQQVANKGARTWRVKPPTIQCVDMPRADWSGLEITEDRKIVLNRGRHGQNLLTLLHELAHYVVGVRGYAVESHGPEFMWIYIELLEQFNVMPRECMLLLCKKYNIEVG